MATEKNEELDATCEPEIQCGPTHYMVTDKQWDFKDDCMLQLLNHPHPPVSLS